ncbi:MAG: hypothetical protein P4M11_10745 [Candidatus Pacebacteria bacterium]|nr:hypothetical protein [Candidatus Paceibacterota bacterium]
MNSPLSLSSLLLIAAEAHDHVEDEEDVDTIRECEFAAAAAVSQHSEAAATNNRSRRRRGERRHRADAASEGTEQRQVRTGDR